MAYSPGCNLAILHTYYLTDRMGSREPVGEGANSCPLRPAPVQGREHASKGGVLNKRKKVAWHKHLKKAKKAAEKRKSDHARS